MSNKIKLFTKPTLRALRPALEADLAKLSAKYGLDFTLGRCSYDAQDATYKLECHIKGTPAKGSAELEMYTDFKMGQCVNVRGLGMSIIEGYKPANRKYPLIIKHAGKSYKISETSVLKAA